MKILIPDGVATPYANPANDPPGSQVLIPAGEYTPYWSPTGDPPEPRITKPLIPPEIRLSRIGEEIRELMKQQEAWKSLIAEAEVEINKLLEQAITIRANL